MHFYTQWEPAAADGGSRLTLLPTQKCLLGKEFCKQVESPRAVRNAFYSEMGGVVLA